MLFAVALAASGFATLPMVFAGPATADSSATPQTPSTIRVPAVGAPTTMTVQDIAGEVQSLVFVTANLDGSLTDVGGRRFALDANILFRFDRADLTSRADAVLGELVAKLRAAEARSIRVDGYTDDVGDTAYNLRLSEQRARTVAAELRSALASGVRITATGHGEQDPIADNATKEGQARNRRVTVVLER